MARRYPLQDQVAFVGVGESAYARDRGRSALGLTVEACVDAVRDAGVDPADIDGIAGSTSGPPAHVVQSALGIPECRWWVNAPIPFTQQVIEAANAVFSGACEVALVYHTTYRNAGSSQSAAQDPFRARAATHSGSSGPDGVDGVVGYAAWASRYLHEYDLGRSDLALVALNGRANAVRNEHAVMRQPLTMEEYLAGRMIREPLCVYDMDLPVDGADAFIVTTAERARTMSPPPVLIHAASLGQTDRPEEDQVLDLERTGQSVVVDALWERSELELDDMDLFYPYDGFSIITLRWLESVGYCGSGEAPDILRASWSDSEGRVLLTGRVPVNTHGGSLSDGGTQGSGHVRESVRQLRGDAGAHQVTGARHALLTLGGFFFNAGGLLLRSAEWS